MTWQLKIDEPSGESRTRPLQGTTTIGRGENCQIILRDPTVAMEAVILWNQSGRKELQDFSPFWMSIPAPSPSGRIGDLTVREAHFPLGIPMRIGETRLTLMNSPKSHLLPELPLHVKSWHTCSEEGKRLLWSVKKAAGTCLSTYISGETGTGKEVIANLIHAWSPRKTAAFVPLHCGALPPSLAESELFGHVKGAFTGAHQHRTGALMQAHGGTLFLDEIGDLSLEMQVKLLRFLENGEIRSVGSDRPSKVDVRIICATHHPLLQLVEQGKFRRDLYYRLASIPLVIPTLRSRPEDISLLASKFAAEFDKTLTPQAILRLQAHCWKGNVRELRHAIERAIGFAGTLSSILGEEAFEFLLTPENVIEKPELELGSSVLSLYEMERVVLLKALKLAQGNRAKSAKILGVARSTLFEMLKRHKIQRSGQQKF